MDNFDVDAFCNAVSVTVVIGCAVLMLPQLYGIIKAGTTKGISPVGSMMQAYAFSMLFVYPYANGYPFTSFMEFSFLSVQAWILMLLVLKENKMLTVGIVSGLALMLALLFAIARGQVPTDILTTLMLTVTPMSAFSKILQLRVILKNKDRGTVSPVTWSIATYTAGIRNVTILLQTGDKVMLVTSVQASILNCAIALSALYYGSSTKKKNV